MDNRKYEPSTAPHMEGTMRTRAAMGPTVPPSTFTPAEWRALRAVRTRHAQERALWSARERARLRFVRWLYQTGRLGR